MSCQDKERAGHVKVMSRSHEIKSSYVRLAHVMTISGPVRADKVRPSEVISGQVRPGQIRAMPVQIRSSQIRGRQCQVGTGQVKVG